MPGLIDLHVHVYDGVSHYGIDADTYLLRRGTTTGVDVGSAGAQTFPGLRRLVIEQARTRVYAYLHIAVEGMISPLVGELEDIRWASVEQCVRWPRPTATSSSASSCARATRWSGPIRGRRSASRSRPPTRSRCR